MAHLPPTIVQVIVVKRLPAVRDVRRRRSTPVRRLAPNAVDCAPGPSAPLPSVRHQLREAEDQREQRQVDRDGQDHAPVHSAAHGPELHPAVATAIGRAEKRLRRNTVSNAGGASNVRTAAGGARFAHGSATGRERPGPLDQARNVRGPTAGVPPGAVPDRGAPGCPRGRRGACRPATSACANGQRRGRLPRSRPVQASRVREA